MHANLLPRRALFALAMTLAMAACGGDDGDRDGGSDARVVDASGDREGGGRDASSSDAGGTRDAALPDAASPDAASPDAAPPDAALPDAALPDASSPDAGPPDAAAPDAALPCPPLHAPVAMPGDDLGGDTYATFASAFFATHCTRCHSATLTTDAARMGAPPGLDWDVEAAVRADLARIRFDVAEGERMPPTAPLPTCDERYRLARWIDAAAP